MLGRETLKNYLETMFVNLPNTAEVRRAKDELWQMMEDKYAELIAEGKSENETIGTIIAEFGNLDELADELGIEAVVRPQLYGAPEEDATENGGVPPVFRRMISMEEAKDYLKDSAGSAFWIALGVMLCIFSVVPPIVADMFGLSDAFVVCMLVIIAAAVAIFVANGIRMQKWEYLKKEQCTIDFATSSMVSERKEQYRSVYTILLSIGIMLCVLSIVPAAILDGLPMFSEVIDVDDVGGAALFVLVGVGVFMIVAGSCTQGGFKKLLSLNDAGTMGGNYKMEMEEKYQSETAENIMSVYWPTVTCIYLCWSFLTFDWGRTWIIWPLAAVICTVIKNIWKK